MKIYKNSSLLMRDKIYGMINHRLLQRGTITLQHVWNLVKHEVTSYDIVATHFRHIMNNMVEEGRAIRTIRNGCYVITKPEGFAVDPVLLKRDNCSVNAWIKSCVVAADETDTEEEQKKPIVRPPAKYGNTSREETIEKYLKMEI